MRLNGSGALFAVGLIVCPAIAFAHPMGNFSINHYSKIKIAGKSVEVRYVIDMAEIPTFQEMRQSGIAPASEAVVVARYLDQQEQLFKNGIFFEIDGAPLQLKTVSRELTFADGAGGLPTMKIGFLFRSATSGTPGVHKLTYADNNFPERAGWKEIVAVGEGAGILSSSASATDRSQGLTNYSSDVLDSPPQQETASVEFEVSIPPEKRISVSTALPRAFPAGAPKVVPAPVSEAAVVALPAAKPQPQKNTPQNRFTQLISTKDNLSFWFLLSAAVIAAGLGALHALEPGHGKTVVAAYLVGSRGTAWHAVLLGIVVTAAHTAGVYLLGVLTLYASRYIVPERLYPWLGAISGMSVAGLGIFVFLRHWTGESGDHSNGSEEPHSHWFLSMFKPRVVNATGPRPAGRALSLRELCVLGITGGMVPCPAALVVLLSAFSLHRIGFGLFLITAFSFGLAGVLVIVGLTMVYAKRAMAARMRPGNCIVRYLPMLSSACMVLLGIGITAAALISVETWRGLISPDKLLPFVTVILVGLFLGMRHSTDPDHVVAVSTIVSRQGSIKSSAIIGLLWGLGHTLTIFLVGSAIIIFGVVIPPRLGLSMEFCVALMLILLGGLNLTGVLNRMGQYTGLSHSQKSASKKASPVLSSPFERLCEGTFGKLGVYQTIRPLAVGLVHGLAGSAAVALLVLSTIKSPIWSTAYLLVFGFGTMVGMMIMTAAISMPLVYAGKKFLKVNRYLIALSGIVSMAFGIFLVYQLGFVDGLFTANVHWIPE